MSAKCESCGCTLPANGDATANGCPECGYAVKTKTYTPPLHADRALATTVVKTPGNGGNASARCRDAPHSFSTPPGYILLDYLAEGGMGYVVKARDTALDRLVAIKLMLPALASDKHFRQRFQREARAAASLRHPNICPIYEVREHEGAPFIVMALIEGQTLGEWERTQKPSARRCAEIMTTLTRAVAYAHQHGIVHRDLKPSNVILEHESGQPVLMDFGLAKMALNEMSQMTQSGQMFGTPAYMPPEQAAGHMNLVGPLSDVYSLGAILYELLTERPPFQGPSGEVIYKVQHAEPEPPRKFRPALHRDIETICLKALSKKPAERYPDCEALAADLERFTAGEAILARRAGPIGHLARSIRRQPRTALFVAAAAVICVAAASYFFHATSVTRRVAVLRQAVESGLGERIPAQEEVQRFDALCAELQTLDAREAATARRLVSQAIERAVRRVLRQPRLENADLAAVRRGLDLLGSHDAKPAAGGAGAGVLEEEFRQRLRSWETIAELTPPYDTQFSDMFQEGVVRSDVEGLRCVKTTASAFGPLCVTKAEAVGNVLLEATFARWREASVVGLGVKAGSGRGYAMVLRAKSIGEGAEQAPSFGNAADGMARASLQVWRAGVLFKEEPIDNASLGEKDLTLRVQREGTLFTIQAGSLPSVTLDDPFPLPANEAGCFEVIVPPEARLSQIRAARQALPISPSPLESADNFYIDGHYEEALGAYRRQEAQTGDTDSNQEVRYKEGICLAALRRNDEAAHLFEALSTQPGKRWPVMALCQLWVQNVEKGQFDEAESLIQIIDLRYDSRQLAASLPQDLRARILNAYEISTHGINILMPDPNRIVKLDRAIKVLRLLYADKAACNWLRWRKMKALHWQGDLAGAEREALNILAQRPNDLDDSSVNPLHELCWILRARGAADEALKIINAHILDASGQPRKQWLELLVTRAVIYCALQKWDEAEADLELLFKNRSPRNMPYHTWGRAYLLKGFLAERRGDQKAAQDAWIKGMIESYQEVHADWQMHDSAEEMMLILMLGSLTDTLKEKHVNMLVDFCSGMTVSGAAGPQNFLRGMYKPPLDVLTAVWRQPRGREKAREIALFSAPLREVALDVPCLLACEAAKRAIKNPLSPEEDEMLWKLSRGFANAYCDSKLGMTQFLQLAMTLKGSTNILGWSGVAPSLTPELRGPAAYFLGLHFRKMGKMDDAEMLWKAALQDAAADSALHKLVAEELRNIKATHSPQPPD